MPSNAISGPDAEKIWDRASEQASNQYGNLKVSNPDKFYSIVMSIYKNMCTKHNCTPKNESDMSMVLRKLELLESSVPKINYPSDPRGYQLYAADDSAVSKKRLGLAVSAINSAIKKASLDIWAVIKKGAYDEDIAGEAIGKAWKKHIFPVLKSYSDVGASDTEAKAETAQKLIDFVKKHYDLRGWTNLGDYI